MLNYNVLNELVRQTKLTKVEFAKQCGITRVTLDNALQGGDIRVSILDSIAKVLKVPVGVLFADESSSQINKVETNGDFSPASLNGDVTISGCVDTAILKERIKALEAIVAEKERLIKVLMEGRK